jgi:membrane-bound lytic murein transglycosylase B
MASRRLLLTSAALLAARCYPAAAKEGFDAFLSEIGAEARRHGISPQTLASAFAGISANPKVIELDRKQPEFVLTWEQYRTTRLSDTRIAHGRAALAQNRGIVSAAAGAYRLDPGIIMGIWGLETNYGTYQGGFNVVEALATLAWDGRRASYFRTELMAALTILEHGDVTAANMVGSYAGAMGQAQFMPDSFLRYAVDFDGDGKRDIWNNTADALGSMANYLSKLGWRAGEAWGESILLPAEFDSSMAGRNKRRPSAEWTRFGVRRADGSPLAEADAAAVILPGGIGGEAFMIYPNFAVIRRYNPSDFYALAVGLLGDKVVA